MSEADGRADRAAGRGVDGPPRAARVSALDVPADLTMYAALLGRHVRIDPTLADPVVAATAAVRANPWSPAVLGGYVSAVVRQRGGRAVAGLNKPEVAAWVRRQSAVAKRRLAESRARVSAAAFSVGAEREAEE